MSAKHNYYKIPIQTKDGLQLYDVLEYQGLFLGKNTNPDRPAIPHSQKNKQKFVLIKYSDDGQPRTLWQGEITNFEAGYNLEIFPHPESPGDYLVFTHPESNLASSHCYWLKNSDNSCTEIMAAQTKLRGLKYIHYHIGKFIGIFHSQTTQRVHIGNSHRINIGGIVLSFRGSQNQLIQRGKQIDITVINIKRLADLDPIYHVCERFCSYNPPGEDYLVFQLNLSVQVKYNILTQETNVTNEVIEFRQPDETLLRDWDELDMPPNPVYNCLNSYVIPGTQDLFVYDTWTWGENNIYIYKDSDKRFHWVKAPNFRRIGYNDVKFLTPNLAIITKYDTHRAEYAQFIVHLDTENLKLTIIRESPLVNCQTISGMANGSILLRDNLYEPITGKHPKPFADQHIAKVAGALTGISLGMGNLVGKWSVALKSTKLGSIA